MLGNPVRAIRRRVFATDFFSVPPHHFTVFNDARSQDASQSAAGVGQSGDTRCIDQQMHFCLIFVQRCFVNIVGRPPTSCARGHQPHEGAVEVPHQHGRYVVEKRDRAARQVAPGGPHLRVHHGGHARLTQLGARGRRICVGDGESRVQNARRQLPARSDQQVVLRRAARVAVEDKVDVHVLAGRRIGRARDPAKKK